jgi:hypothetical protein
MDHQTWGYLQLGLFALAFAGLQFWWIGSVLRRRDPPPRLNEGELRRTLERIWDRRS